MFRPAVVAIVVAACADSGHPRPPADPRNGTITGVATVASPHADIGTPVTWTSNPHSSS